MIVCSRLKQKKGIFINLVLMLYVYIDVFYMLCSTLFNIIRKKIFPCFLESSISYLLTSDAAKYITYKCSIYL